MTQQTVAAYFTNYQIEKLDVVYPNLVNLLLLTIFFLIVIISAKKDLSASNKLLGVLHTEHVKGVAIFLVVLGHLWVHVSKTKIHFVLSSEAVSIFLIISGFGLTMSNMHKKINFGDFYSKRIRRVMVPYWIATIVILSLDYLLLDKKLPISSFLMTSVGINVTRELTSVDYVRWFVTFILLWYILFFLCHTKLQEKNLALSLLGIGIILLPLDYYFFRFGWNQFLSFPAGCALAIYSDKLLLMFRGNKRQVLLALVTAISFVLIYRFIMAQENINHAITRSIPNIMLAYLSEGNSLIIGLSTIFLVGYFVEKGYRSKVLHLLGKYSYEIFLLHGAFLIKYNPIIKDAGTVGLIAEFSLFLVLSVALSLLLFSASQHVYVGNASVKP